ncbi:hypothetical protein ACF1BQ_044190 [Bradyrhizobium sp. RDT10]
MAGLVPAIHVLVTLQRKTWMPGTSSAKTRFALLPGHDEVETQVFFPFTAASKLAFAEPGRSASSAARSAPTQNRENNPMQSRMGPGSQRACCLRTGTTRKMVRRHGPPYEAVNLFMAEGRRP